MPYPVVLVHGIAPFNRLVPGMEYWHGIRPILESAGRAVYESEVVWAGSVSERAQQLTDNIRDYLAKHPPGTKVNIIAHSSGGLDARYAIVKCNLAPCVASLTTLGTPHHGSPVADWLQKPNVGIALKTVFDTLHVDISGLKDLTRAACEARNTELKPFEDCNAYGVIYQTYAGWQDVDDIFGLLLPAYRLIKKFEGINDGLVSVRSATWESRYLKRVVNLDHLNFLGWWDPAELDLFGKSRDPETFKQEVCELYLSIIEPLP